MNSRLTRFDAEPILLDPTTIAAAGIGAQAIGGALSASQNVEPKSFGTFAPTAASSLYGDLRANYAAANAMRGAPIPLPNVPSVIGQPTQFQLPGSGQMINLGIDGSAFANLDVPTGGYLHRPAGARGTAPPPPEGPPETLDDDGNRTGYAPGRANERGSDEPRITGLSDDGTTIFPETLSPSTSLASGASPRTGSRSPSGPSGPSPSGPTPTGSPAQVSPELARGAIAGLDPQNRDLLQRRVFSLLDQLQTNGRLG